LPSELPSSGPVQSFPSSFFARSMKSAIFTNLSPRSSQTVTLLLDVERPVCSMFHSVPRPMPLPVPEIQMRGFFDQLSTAMNVALAIRRAECFFAL
jgi:hypothetical protein